MSHLVDASDIERLVGAKRHPTDHLARAITNVEMVYILHSQACKDSGIDLRDCAYSIALDRGIEHPLPWSEWRRAPDRPVRVEIYAGWLVPARSEQDPDS
jgi:hypothetical protein